MSTNWGRPAEELGQVAPIRRNPIGILIVDFPAEIRIALELFHCMNRSHAHCYCLHRKRAVACPTHRAKVRPLSSLFGVGVYGLCWIPRPTDDRSLMTDD